MVFYPESFPRVIHFKCAIMLDEQMNHICYNAILLCQCLQLTQSQSASVLLYFPLKKKKLFIKLDIFLVPKCR